MYKELITKIAHLLNEQNIPYMIIGGQAVLLYGEPRFTRDVDISLGLDAEGFLLIKNICELLSLRILPDKPQAFVQDTMVLPCMEEETGIRIDFIFTNTEYEHNAIKKAAVFDFGGIPVHFAGKEDVIILKIIAGRERDFEDIRSILLKNKDIDENYIVKNLKIFDDLMDTNILNKWLELRAN